MRDRYACSSQKRKRTWFTCAIKAQSMGNQTVPCVLRGLAEAPVPPQPPSTRAPLAQEQALAPMKGRLRAQPLRALRLR